MTKPTKWHVCPAKTQIRLGIRPVWSESSLSAWRKLEPLATHWVHSQDSDQTGRMPRLIWVFAGHTVIFLVLSWDGSLLFFPCIMLLWCTIVNCENCLIIGWIVKHWWWLCKELCKERRWFRSHKISSRCLNLTVVNIVFSFPFHLLSEWIGL